MSELLNRTNDDSNSPMIGIAVILNSADNIIF